MVTTGSINLIHSKANENPHLDAITSVLRRVSYAAVITLVLSGILVGAIYAFLQASSTQLEIKNDTLKATVSGDSPKEGILLAIKQRIAVIDKIMASQKDMDKLFGIISEITPVGNLKSLSIDDNNKTTISVQVATISDAVTMVDTLLNLATSGSVTKASLLTFSLTKDQGFNISFSFVPIL